MPNNRAVDGARIESASSKLRRDCDLFGFKILDKGVNGRCACGAISGEGSTVIPFAAIPSAKSIAPSPSLT